MRGLRRPGVYASWLAEQGHSVHLIDPVPRHVAEAEAAAKAQPEHPFTAALGEARSLDAADATHDSVLLMGPMYHLVERSDRLQALGEALRVVRPADRVYRVLQKHGIGLRGRGNGSARTEAPARRGSARRSRRPVSRQRATQAPLRSPRTPATAATSVSTQFRSQFRMERVINAVDIRDALRQADSLGATDITHISR